LYINSRSTNFSLKAAITFPSITWGFLDTEKTLPWPLGITRFQSLTMLALNIWKTVQYINEVENVEKENIRKILSQSSIAA
jgi:hypothetical protein